MANEFIYPSSERREHERLRSSSCKVPCAEFPSGKMLLKWVDVLGFELALRHKKSATSPTERHKRSYRSVTPLDARRLPTFN
jgi:hypothetical protein